MRRARIKAAAARRTSRVRAGALLCVLAALVPAAAPAVADEDHEPLLVTYGPQAATAEGDLDHRQVIYISVPLERETPIFVRLFDPDTSGAYDTAIGAWRDSSTRFALYGGAGAFHAPADVADAAPKGGALIAEHVFGPSSRSDGTWMIFAEVMPDQGQPVQGRAVFRLEVEGVRGDDGNVYDVFASGAPDHNLQPLNVDMFAYRPTVRVPDDDRMVEIQFSVPAGARLLTARNFDASGAEIAFTTPFRTVDLEPSGQDAWAEGAIAIEPADIGRTAALTVRGGDEIPNDITLDVAIDTGGLVPLQLPPRRWAANRRPTARLVQTPVDCTIVEFSVEDAFDADGDRLETFWIFDDGAILSGDNVLYGFADPGTYEARVEVLGQSGIVANGWARDFTVDVKAPPVAVVRAPAVAALGEPVRLDGTGSYSPGHEIVRHDWTFPDGTVDHGPFVNHTFRTAGLHDLRLDVEDDVAHPCNADATGFTVRVNARPTADAGADRHVAVGEALAFTLGASADSDGEISTARWLFGDGSKGEGASVEHAYAEPGEYQVALYVDDGSGVSNSVGLDVARVRVNAPPVADAGEARSAEIGETVAFDASRSHDPDGSIIDYVWDFGDGTTKSGERVTHAYRDAGRYAVSLTVTDASGRMNASAVDETGIEIRENGNVSPRADAGGDISAAIGEVVTFDGSASRDPDGNIIAYEWDFGDGATATGVTAQYVFLHSGDHRVRLTVRDDSGKPNDTSEVEIAVRAFVPTNAAPVAEAGPDLTASVGDVVRFDASGSHDADGNVIAYDWDFGNGMHGVGVAPIHTYFEAGDYRVTLRVRDDSAFATEDTDTLLVTVLPRADAEGGQ